MNRLAPNLFDLRYRKLVDFGRSRLPSIAPGWNDHNAHDPGITLIELLAWTAEAQIYSLSKMRRDEREGYAALMGIETHGSRPAVGMIWPNHDDPGGPAAVILRGKIIDPELPIYLERAETPQFYAMHRQLWIPARISALRSRRADGSEVDHWDANRRGGPAFQPFGVDEGPASVLRMSLQATGHDPLFEPGRPPDARLIFGIRVAGSTPAVSDNGSVPMVSPIEVTLVAGGERVILTVVEDSTGGLIRTGFLALDISGFESQPDSVDLEFRAPGGLACSPLLVRIEPNVVPIIQRTWLNETPESNGMPDQAFDLERSELEFEPGDDPVSIEVEALGTRETWSQTAKLRECGPQDHKFLFDPIAARVTFGNGVNGTIPPKESKIHISYTVTEGQVGNIAANRKWVVAGFSGPFGVNPDPTAGGQKASGWKDQRRAARRELKEAHALISARDFEQAARDLPGLKVGRAWMVPQSTGDAATGTMRLIALRARLGGHEAANDAETPRWLESIRSSLASRVALGSRLRVIAPRYVQFSISARIVVEKGSEPDAACRHAFDEINRRLSPISETPGIRERAFGLAVARSDLMAWIQALPEIRQVTELTIRVAGRGQVGAVELPADGLPSFDPGQSDIRAIPDLNGGST